MRLQANRFRGQTLQRALKKSTNCSHIVILDDDATLCDNFRLIVERCVQTFPDAVFSCWNYLLNKEDRLVDSPYVKPLNKKLYGLCMIIPSKYISSKKYPT